MTASASNLSLSVVVAAWPDATGLAPALEALDAQSETPDEILVAGIGAPPEEVRRRAGVRWLEAAPQALIPHLWAHGIAAARGEVVALTTAQFVAAPDWVACMRDAHRRLDAVGIGGAIDPPRGGGAAAWATYLLRYSNLFEYSREQPVRDFAGDNASYRRAALERYWPAGSKGFWEPEIHRRVIADGRRLAFVPAIRVTQRSAFGVRRFCAQRFRHGQRFGRDRVAGKPALVRAARLVTAPLIPFVLLAKIVRRLGHRPACVPAFLGALPVLALFACAWALGETRGYRDAGA